MRDRPDRPRPAGGFARPPRPGRTPTGPGREPGREPGSLASLGSGGGQALAALPSQAAAELDRLELELGGRQALVLALTYAPPHKDIRYILGLLGDPDHQVLRLSEVCHLGRVMPGQLVDALAKGSELRARLLATQAISRRLPAVVEDVMLKAAPYQESCPACQGLGSRMPDPTPEEPNPAQEMCPQCLGHGQLRYDADGKCRDLALEMGGLLQKGGGIHITNTQQVATLQAGGASGVEGFQELLDAVLFGQEGGRAPLDTAETDGDEPAVDGEVLAAGADGVGDDARTDPSPQPSESDPAP